MLVSCEASFKFYRPCFQNKRSARCFRQFTRKSFQNDGFVRGFLKISQNKLSKRAFRAMLPTIFTKNLPFATVSCQSTHRFLREGSSAKSKMCLALQRRAFPNVDNVRFATAPCAKMYESIDREPTPLRAHKNVRFYYSFGQSTPRFY